MLKKWVASVLIVTLCLFCLPVFSFADQNVTMYASIPRPLPSENVKYVVSQNLDQTSGNLFMYIIPDFVSAENYVISAAVLTDGSIDLLFYSVDIPVSFNVTVLKFDLNGNFIYSEQRIIPSSSSLLEPVRLSNFSSPDQAYIDFFDIPISDGTVSYSYSLPSIAWSDSTDPLVYTSFLTIIYHKLGEIDSNTDNIESQLSSISSQLTLFYSLFNSYQMQQHQDLVNIYNKVIDIYNALLQEPETRPPAIENQDDVNNVLQNEAALNKDFSGDLQNQFNVAGNIFDGNSAFAFISNAFSDMLLSNISINGLIIFSLAIGLCVLILGRRLNA